MGNYIYIHIIHYHYMYIYIYTCLREINGHQLIPCHCEVPSEPLLSLSPSPGGTVRKLRAALGFFFFEGPRGAVG